MMAMDSMHREKRDDVFELHNPYAHLPDMEYLTDSRRPYKKTELTTKQKKVRGKNKSAKKSRRNNRKRK